MTTSRHGSRLEIRRLGVFLLVAFGIAWAVGGVLYATGGLTDSPAVLSVGGVSVTLASVLLPTGYMFAPAIANVATRWITGEGRDGLRLRPRFEESIRYYALAWVAPALLTALGSGLFFLAFPRHFDPSMTAFTELLDQQAGGAIDPRTVVAVQAISAVTVAPAINAVFAFGEEFGWRAYLLPKLTPLGTRRAVVVHGLIWGVWHWPVILMGYEYGFGYPGAPWAGLAVFPVFTIAVGTFLAWVTLRSDSVWPAAIGHGAINAVTGLGALFVRGDPNPLLGPLPIGVVAGVPWLLFAAFLLVRIGRAKSSPSPVA